MGYSLIETRYVANQGVVTHGPTVEAFKTGIKIGSNDQDSFSGTIKQSRNFSATVNIKINATKRACVLVCACALYKHWAAREPTQSGRAALSVRDDRRNWLSLTLSESLFTCTWASQLWRCGISILEDCRITLGQKWSKSWLSFYITSFLPLLYLSIITWTGK